MYRLLAFVIGAVVVAAGVGMVPAAIVSAIYTEWDVSLQILGASAVTVSVGLVGWRRIGRTGQFTTEEGFATVGLAWFFLAFFGTLPYLFSGAIPNLIDAFF